MDKHFKYTEDFIQKLKGMDKRAFINRATNEAGVIAIGFSKGRFVHKNWIDKTREQWTPRQTKGKGSLMTATGRLKRSIRKIYAGYGYVVIGTDVPYAKIHNEGGTITETVNVKSHTRKYTKTTRVRNPKTKRLRQQRTKTTFKVKAHSRKMNLELPKRQFMGESAVLLRQIHNNTYRLMQKQLKK